MKCLYLCIFIVCLSCGTNNPQDATDDAPLATEISHADIDGIPRTLSSYQGKVVVLNFFATWCAPCQAEMPLLENNIWRAYQNRDVVVWGIDLQEDLGRVKLFAVNNDLTFPMIIDESGDIFRTYSGGSVPFNVIIDQNQRIRYAKAGYEEDNMIHIINGLLTQ